jgi:DNA-directed RNA polymerase subunit RPC12/RpoP
MDDTNNEFICRRCGEKLTTKQNLIRHINSKDKCNATIEQISKEDYLKSLQRQKNDNAVACRYCGSLFNHMSNVYTHHKICKKNPTSNNYQGETSNEPINVQQEVSILKEQLESKDKEIIKLKEDNNKLQELLNKYQQNMTINFTSHSGTGDINVNQNITQYIILKNFGEESRDHINEEFILNCIMREGTGVRNLVEKLHFDEQVPENKNVRYKSIKRRVVEIVENDSWVPKDEKEIIKCMIRKACNAMREYYNQDEELQEKDDNYYEMKISKYLTEILEYKMKYKNIRDMVKALIEQNT